MHRTTSVCAPAGSKSNLWQHGREAPFVVRTAFFLGTSGRAGSLCRVSLALVRQAAEAASASNGPLHGYPPWLIVVVGALVAALLLWIFGKLVRWTLWVLIIVVLIGGLIMGYQMYFGPAPASAPAPASSPAAPRP